MLLQRLPVVVSLSRPYCRPKLKRLAHRPLNTTAIFNMPSKDKYTDPELRDEVKEEIHQSDKGGAPGQWSARKVRDIVRSCSLADS